MSSAETTLVPGPAIDPGARLVRETARVAAALAELLDRVLPDADGRAASRNFLRVMARDDGEPGIRWRAAPSVHPLDRLVTGFRLSPLERDLVILAGLPDEHEGYAAILRSVHPRCEPHPTAGLAAQLFCARPAERGMLRSLLEEGAAARAGILRLAEDGPFFERSILLADSLWSALHGVDRWPAALAVSEGAALGAGLAGWLAGDEALRARAAIASGEGLTVLVVAETEEIAQRRGVALVEAAGSVPARLTLAAGAERLLSVHAVARGVVPVVWADSAALAGHPGPVVLCAGAGGIAVRGDRPLLEVAAGRLTPSERREVWRAVAPELAEHAAALASRYTVEPEVAAAAAEDARVAARLAGREVEVEDVARGVRTRARLALSGGVRFVRPTARWEQLVLPTKRLAQLREAVDRLRNQPRVLDDWGFLAGRPGARGVRMLFAGGSGTGKTFSAEVMAGELGVDLLVVDISRVVSKWIGETEKNLAEVFDVAERAQAVLLFDEADALFGRRTEISDARDRYANLETAFLLTRLERFEGLAILSTNLRQNLDSAFLRRIELAVDFVEPGPDERAALWRGHLPPGAPLAADVDLRELAALYPVVGGFIRNAAVAAGFLAAAEGSPITRTHLVRAVRREYEKSGRAFPGIPAGMAAP